MTIIIQQILAHIMVWVQPEWSYPPPTSQCYKEFSWESEVQIVLFADVVEEGNTLTDEFLSCLMKQVQNDCMWQDSLNKKQIRK